jgi:hypothetical protein
LFRYANREPIRIGESVAITGALPLSRRLPFPLTSIWANTVCLSIALLKFLMTPVDGLKVKFRKSPDTSPVVVL